MPLPVIQKESDGRFLPPLLFQTPKTTLKNKDFSSSAVPLIIGVNSQELKGFLPSNSQNQLEFKYQ
jgi:hypothetical protein